MGPLISYTTIVSVNRRGHGSAGLCVCLTSAPVTCHSAWFKHQTTQAGKGSRLLTDLFSTTGETDPGLTVSSSELSLM